MDECERNKNEMSLGRIIDALQLRFPGRSSLANERDIKDRKTGLTEKYKKHGSTALKGRGNKKTFQKYH